MKEFNLIQTNQDEYNHDLKLVNTEYGFELLDNNRFPIIRAHNITTTGEFHVVINSPLFGDKYRVRLVQIDNDKLYHFKVEKNI